MKFDSWPVAARGSVKVRSRKLPVRRRAPAYGAALPKTIAEGARVLGAGAVPKRVSAHESASLIVASPLEVSETMPFVEPDALPTPVWPPKETSTVTGASVVFLKVSTQRPQLAVRLKRICREIATPPMSTERVEVKRSGGSKRRPKPRTSSPLRSASVETSTRMPP